MTEPARRGLSGMAEGFLSRKLQELEYLAAEARAAGRRGYDIAAKSAPYLLRPDLAGFDLGSRIVGGGLAPAAVKRQSTAAKRPAPSRPVPRQPSPSRVTAQPGRSWLDRNEVAKAVAGEAARNVAIPLGAARGVWHTAEDIGDLAIFAGRLFNPMDRFSPPGQSARDELVNGIQSAGRYAKSRVSQPHLAVRDLGDGLHRFRLSVDPSATPQADTFMGEVGRSFGIGLNQGEMAGDVGQLFLGAGELKALSKLGKYSQALKEAELLEQGHSPRVARYFSEKYDGIGHHVIAQRKRLPKLFGGGPIPPVVSDSPFFRLRPPDLSKKEFFKLHVGVDKSYNGGRLRGGGGWSAKNLGWEKYGPLERLWHGTTKPMKYTALGGGALATGAAVDTAQDREGRR